MLDFLTNIEGSAAKCSALVLVLPGVIAVVAGLMFWLGGLKLSKIIAVILGSVAGAMVGYCITRGSRLAGAFFGAAGAAVLALVFEKLIIVMLGALILSTIAVALVAAHFVGHFDFGAVQQAVSQMSSLQSLEFVAGQTGQLVEKSREIAGQVPWFTWPVAAIIMVTLFVLGLIFVRLIVAMSCSTVGATLIFAGMSLLLLYKGAAPLTHIYRLTWYYLGVFAAMIAFGTVVQLALCSGHTPPVPTESAAQEVPISNKVRGDV